LFFEFRHKARIKFRTNHVPIVRPRVGLDSKNPCGTHRPPEQDPQRRDTARSVLEKPHAKRVYRKPPLSVRNSSDGSRRRATRTSTSRGRAQLI
jgi:hypothetical protein